MENLKKSGELVKSFCKINIFLKVLSKRKDGFHNIFSYMVPINFYDEIFFEEIKEGIEVETIGAEIEKEENLVYKGAKMLFEYSKNKKGIKIKIKKNVPLGSGLGGGSSNCATTLKHLNRFWDCNLSNKELKELGLKIGSDIPFFIDCVPAFVSGRGEKIFQKKINLKFPEEIVLFIPPISISTKDVYNAFDKLSKKKERFNKKEFLENLSFENLKNDLQEAAFLVCPELKEIYSMIKKTKPEFLILSGSGSAFWGFYNNKEKEEEARNHLTKSIKFYILSFKDFYTFFRRNLYGFCKSSGLP